MPIEIKAVPKDKFRAFIKEQGGEIPEDDKVFETATKGDTQS
jgi:hypothetical protein